MFSSCNVARFRTISRTKATRITTIVCMLQTLAGSGLKCQDFYGRRGFEERQEQGGFLIVPEQPPAEEWERRVKENQRKARGESEESGTVQ